MCLWWCCYRQIYCASSNIKYPFVYIIFNKNNILVIHSLYYIVYHYVRFHLLNLFFKVFFKITCHIKLAAASNALCFLYLLIVPRGHVKWFTYNTEIFMITAYDVRTMTKSPNDTFLRMSPSRVMHTCVHTKDNSCCWMSG